MKTMDNVTIPNNIYTNFSDLLRNGDLLGKDLLFWRQSGLNKYDPVIQRIIGITYIPNDILLHLVAPSIEFKRMEDAAKEQGIAFIPLSKFLTSMGFELRPEYEIDEIDENNGKDQYGNIENIENIERGKTK